MTIIQSTITKQEIANLPKELYEGPISTIVSDGEAKRVFNALKSYKAVGIDTETRPSFQKGKVNNVALLQIATEDHCWLIRLNKTGVTNNVKRFLEDDRILKIGLSLKDDFRTLHRNKNFTPRAYVELQQLMDEFGVKDKSLQKIYGILFGKKISKSQRLTNWEADELTESQKRYAATDAWACLEIYKRVNSLKSLGEYTIVENNNECETKDETINDAQDHNA